MFGGLTQYPGTKGVVVPNKYLKWESISYEDFKEIVNLINYYKSRYNTVCFVLTNVLF